MVPVAAGVGAPGMVGSGVERQMWLAERRAALVAGYDAGAATYGDDEYPWDMQREWVARVLRLIPPGAMEGLAIVSEGFRRENGWGYRHFLLRTSPAAPRS